MFGLSEEDEASLDRGLVRDFGLLIPYREYDMQGVLNGKYSTQFY